jgi:hypothetical protein
MKKLLILLFCIFLSNLYGEHNFEKLHPYMKKLYSKINEPKKLIGTTHSIECTLKFISTDHILINEGYIRVDKTTKYSFLNFEKKMNLSPSQLKLKKVILKFQITRIPSNEINGKMPHLIVKLINISKI